MPRRRRSRCPRCSSASSPAGAAPDLLPNLIGIENALKVVIENPLKKNRTLKGQDAFELGIADAIFASANFLEDSHPVGRRRDLGSRSRSSARTSRARSSALVKWDAAIGIATKMLKSRIGSVAAVPVRGARPA